MIERVAAGAAGASVIAAAVLAVVIQSPGVLLLAVPSTVVGLPVVALLERVGRDLRARVLWATVALAAVLVIAGLFGPIAGRVPTAAAVLGGAGGGTAALMLLAAGSSAIGGRLVDGHVGLRVAAVLVPATLVHVWRPIISGFECTTDTRAGTVCTRVDQPLLPNLALAGAVALGLVLLMAASPSRRQRTLGAS